VDTAPRDTRQRSISRVLWIVLGLNLLVAAAKLFVGLTTGALAVIADAVHSAFDASSNIIGLIGLAIAGRPPDPSHPYGHRKYETFATLIIGGLLLVASWEILKGAVERWFSGSTLQVSNLSIVIAALTFPANLAIAAYEGREGRRLNSSLLLADAVHTRTDLFVTVGVVASLVAARLGAAWVDLAVAVIVGGIIVAAALKIIRSTSDVLADSAMVPAGEVERVAAAVPGVWFVHRVRSRGSEDAAYVDLHVKVDPAMATTQAHAIASEVEHKLRTELPGVVDAVVHIEPGRDRPPTEWQALAVRLRALADGLGLGVHDLHAHVEPGGGYAVETHVEVDASLALGEAHALVDAFEQRVRAELPEVRSFITHIEPIGDHVTGEAGVVLGRAAIQRLALDIADSICGPGSCHDIELHNVDGHLTATLHCALPADVPLVQAHALAERVQRELTDRIRPLQRAVVHVEPPEAA
jgi:cation diffusion facilitator family transporter